MAGETSQQPEARPERTETTNIESETEPEPLNTGEPKLLNNDKRAYNVTE
jgi:hypothetical protein